MRKDWKEVGEFIETDMNGIGYMKIKEAEGNLNIVVIYNKENGKEKKIGEAIKKITENCVGERIIVDGDFNIRTGELGDEEKEEITRKNRDKQNNRKRRQEIDGFNARIRLIEILNSKTESDWEGEHTYIGARGSTVIDYIFTYRSE